MKGRAYVNLLNDEGKTPMAVAQEAGNTWAFRAFLDTKLSVELFGSPLILRLQVEEGQTKSPQQPWKKTHDRADLDGLYVYRL